MKYDTKPVYQKIAIDIANRILAGDFSIGEKLHGRSSLSSHYNVSPETIRKAIILLNDMDIVESIKGSGIIIKSVDKCLKFIDKFKNINSINSMRKEILELQNQRRTLDSEIEGKLNEIIDYSNRFIKTNPFIPLEFEIYKGLSIIGKTVSESKFWQNTNATVIGVRRNGELVLSPGPYVVFQEKDIFIAIGPEESYYKIKEFIYGSADGIPGKINVNTNY